MLSTALFDLLLTSNKNVEGGKTWYMRLKQLNLNQHHAPVVQCMKLLKMRGQYWQLKGLAPISKWLPVFSKRRKHDHLMKLTNMVQYGLE